THEILVALDSWPRPPFLGPKPLERLCGHDAPCEAHAGDGDLAILVRRQVIQRDRRRDARVRAPDAHMPAARRLQVANRRRDCIERMERIAELVERQRLYVPFEVRRRTLGSALRERAEL